MKRQQLALKWLNKEFGNLTPVIKDNRTFYIDENRLPLFFYRQDENTGVIFINYKRIWAFFGTIFILDYPQTQSILKVWLEDTYNLGGVTPKLTDNFLNQLLENDPNLNEVSPLTINILDNDGWRRPIN